MPVIDPQTAFDNTAINQSLTLFGVQAPPPPPPTAPATLGTAPTVSSTPSAGQGVALTPSGVLPPSAAATGLRMRASDPASPLIGEFWFRTDTLQFCVKTAAGVKRVTLA